MPGADKPVSNDPFALAGKTISHYRVQEVLGGGGMGVVYRAEDTRLRRSVALKFLPPALGHDESAKERFLAEAQAASALDHPNICTVHEFGSTDDGQLFLAMAYYAGASLRERFENAPLAPSEALDLAVEIARGLAAAHEAGIVHRDIKPANVMLTEDGVAKIVDFGIARIGDANLTRTGATVGTAGYMSPEQTRGEAVDGRTDLWALGVLLYEALTGTLPFRGSYDQAVVFSILHEDPEPPTALNPRVPDELSAVVTRCLQKAPSARYRDAEALLADLEAIRAGTAPHSAERPPVLPPVRGRRALVWTGVSALAILAALFLGRQLLLPRAPLASRPIQVSVLPFTNVSGDSTDQAFINGLGYTVSATLTEMEQFAERISVLPADVENLSAMSLGEAAEFLNADVLVTGSIQRLGERIRLTLSLFDAESDRQTRSRILDNESANPLALQDSVAIALAQLLDIELSASEEQTLTAGGTTSPEAFDAYTQARGYLLNYEDERNIDRAIEQFERAIASDSRYVRAHAGLGEAFWRKFDASSDPQWMERAAASAEHAAELNADLASVRFTLGLVYKGTGRYADAEREFLRVLEIDSSNAFAHQQLAATYYFLSRFDEAEAHYLRAIDLKPDYWAFHNTLGYLYRNQGRFEDAAREYRRVIERRPESPEGYNHLGTQYLTREMPDSALVWFRRAAEVNPEAKGATAWAYSNIGAIHFRRREFLEAAAMYERAVRLNDAESDFWYFLAGAYEWAGDASRAEDAWRTVIEIDSRGLEVNPNDPNALIGLAFGYAMTGENDRARHMLERLENNPTKVRLIQNVMAEIAEQLGERERALRYLEEGFELGLNPEDVAASPWLDALRADPRYEALLP